eukprot:154624-Rhodomonas_salina.1
MPEHRSIVAEFLQVLLSYASATPCPVLTRRNNNVRCQDTCTATGFACGEVWLRPVKRVQAEGGGGRRARQRGRRRSAFASRDSA